MSAFWADWKFWLYFAAWLPFTALAIWYGLSLPRNKDAVGRSLLYVKASLSAVLTIVLTAFIWPEYQWRDALLVIGMSGVVIAGWNQLWVFARTRRGACPNEPALTRQFTHDEPGEMT